jgi:predicted nucleic acid-binding protein
MTLRRKGVSIRKTIDTIIATSCLEHGCTPLHRDRDFDAFEKHPGWNVVKA